MHLITTAIDQAESVQKRKMVYQLQRFADTETVWYVNMSVHAHLLSPPPHRQ
jgi:hypothetical protein